MCIHKQGLIKIELEIAATLKNEPIRDQIDFI
jgi:hypothetical protein